MHIICIAIFGLKSPGQCYVSQSSAGVPLRAIRGHSFGLCVYVLTGCNWTICWLFCVIQGFSLAVAVTCSCLRLSCVFALFSPVLDYVWIIKSCTWIILFLESSRDRRLKPLLDPAAWGTRLYSLKGKPGFKGWRSFAKREWRYGPLPRDSGLGRRGWAFKVWTLRTFLIFVWMNPYCSGRWNGWSFWISGLLQIFAAPEGG